MKQKKIASIIMGMDNQITAIQYAETHGLNWSMVKSTFHRNGMSTGKHTVLTAEMLAVLSGQKPAAATPKPRVLKPGIQHQPKPDAEPAQPKEKPKTEPQPQPEPKTATTKKTAEWWQVVTVCFLVSLLSVSLTTLGLGMFAKWAGYILGGMFALTLISSLLVARNKQKGDTSQSALNTVLYMEVGASFLHCFTFYVLLPDCNEYLKITAAGLMAGFVAFLSYKAVQFVRNYNAEI